MTNNCFSFLLIVYFAYFSTCQDVEITINNGKLVGEWKKSSNGKPFAAFLSIPYAKPPIEERRFEAPQLPDSWDGVRNAKKLPNVCFQWSSFGDNQNPIIGDEDCLYINVYSSKPEESANLNVIVYIHGGSFMWGSSTTYGPNYLMNENLVLVTFNYRVGPLGFLSTLDETIPGNNGLKDQSMALKWVRDNIKRFGGNPNSVTAMGTGAGGASVEYHLISPLSKGLIHKAITQSGSLCNPWAMQTRPREKAFEIGATLECPTDSCTALVECLKKKTATDILKTVPHFMPFLHGPLSPFGPVIEPIDTNNAFINKLPYSSIQNGEMTDVPRMLSFTSEEGLYPVGMYIRFPELLNFMNVGWIEFAPHLLHFNDTITSIDVKQSVAKKIKDVYLDGKDISLDTISDLIKMFGDRLFKRGTEKCAKLEASVKNSSMYAYMYNFLGDFSFSDVLTGGTKKYGVSQGDDVIRVFEFVQTIESDRDIEMSKVLVKIIVSFANNGVPFVEKETWLPLDKNSDMMNVLEIKSPNDFKMQSMKTVITSNVWDEFPFKENEHYYD